MDAADASPISRAEACLAGLLIGDALGGQVEFMSPSRIAGLHLGGVRELRDGGVWNTTAGQPTDDGEMALAMASAILETGHYDPERARLAYSQWMASGPFDCGSTIAKALRGEPNPMSQANGAMMRAAPLGILTATGPTDLAMRIAAQDARLTHPNRVAVEANQLFVALLARLIRSDANTTPAELLEELVAELRRASDGSSLAPALEEVIAASASAPPADYVAHMGWVLIALQNALWQWQRSVDFEEALVDTISRGGDTDTNAAICGALLGAACGIEAIPARWLSTLEACRPGPGSTRPRPKVYWPCGFRKMAAALVVASLRAA